MGTSFMNPAIRGSLTTGARMEQAPNYQAKGQGIAAQKYLDIAKGFANAKAKKSQRSSAYPPGPSL